MGSMKRKLSILFLLPFIVGCNKGVDATGEYLGKEFIVFDNSKEDNAKYNIRHGYTNGGMFLSYWDYNNVKIVDGIAEVSLYDTEDKNYGAEIKSNEGFLYGYFGARMKTFKKRGTVQSLFTYNGGPRYIWDEIDIEFLGKDTTKVQFNYYHEGVGGHEYMYDLGFDSSSDFHDYGFKWEKDKITWFVDFKPVYAVEASLGQWGYLMLNVWAGKDNQTLNWLGRYDKDDQKHTAYYQYLSYSPLKNNID